MSTTIPQSIIKFIQNCTSLIPTIVLGSGFSAAFGIPGMYELSRYLIDNVCPDFNEKEQWHKFKVELEKGTDLERALHLVDMPTSLEEKIVLKTKELIFEKDIRIRRQVVLKEINMPLSNLLKFFNTATTPNIKIVTTNYDRLAEYATDLANLTQYSGFEGQYMKKFNKRLKKISKSDNSVEILKVHGSLDWYRSTESEVLSLPDDFKINTELKPVMVTPGKGKYLHTHDDPFRSLITRVDEVFEEAKSIIIVGFGFNDFHIQPKLVNKMRDSKTPILIISKSLTPQARTFIKDNKNAKILGIEEHENGAKIISPASPDIIIKEPIWELKEMLNIIL